MSRLLRPWAKPTAELLKMNSLQSHELHPTQEDEELEMEEAEAEAWGTPSDFLWFHQSGQYELQGFTVGRPWMGKGSGLKPKVNPITFERIRMSLNVGLLAAKTAPGKKKSRSMFACCTPSAADEDEDTDIFGVLTCGLRKRKKQTRMPIMDFSFGSVEVRGFLFECEDEKEMDGDKALLAWKQVALLNYKAGLASRGETIYLQPSSKAAPAPRKKSNKISDEETGRKSRKESRSGRKKDKPSDSPHEALTPSGSLKQGLDDLQSIRESEALDMWAGRGPGLRTPSEKGSVKGSRRSVSGNSVRSSSSRGNGEAYRDVLNETEEADDDAFRLRPDEQEDSLKVSGKAQVGGQLMAVVPRSWLSQVQQGHKCFIQWYRCQRDSEWETVAEKIDGALYAKYQPTDADMGCRVQVVAAIVLNSGKVFSAQTALTEWIREDRRRSGGSRRAGSSYASSIGGRSAGGRSRKGGKSSSGATSRETSVQGSETASALLTSSPIQIIGETVVGGTLLVAAPEWSDVHKSSGLTVDTCKIQWLRGHKDRSGRYSFNKIVGAKTPRYLITKQDMNCRLRVVAAPIKDGQVGKAWTTLSARVTSGRSGSSLSTTKEG